jgi:hypothetical protein
MIQRLWYEPQGQRQRFEPHEQWQHESASRQVHLHLHLHLNLGRRLNRSSPTVIARLTTLFAAFLGALSMALTLYLQVTARIISTQAPLFSWAGNLVLIGTLLGFGAVLLGGIPLISAAWRSTPRSRFLFLVPFLAFVLTFVVVALGTYIADPAIRSVLLVAPLYALPFICILAITHALRQATIADKWLRFANRLSPLVVLGILLMLIGVLLWGFALALFAPGWFFILLPLFAFPWNSWLLIALGMLIAFLIAVFAFLAPLRARSRPAPRQEPPGTWG